MTDDPHPAEYVQQNKHTLVKILKHSSDSFVRALALAALIEYGEDADVESVIKELKQYRREDD